MLGRLPPPPAGADVLAGLHRSGARRATDGRIALRVQSIYRERALTRVLPKLRRRPGDQRVELHHASVRAVDFHELHTGAGRSLLSPKAGDPGLSARERPRERLDLANSAALPAVGDALAEGEEAFLALQSLDAGTVREPALDLNAVSLLHRLHHLVGLRRQAAGVEREHAQPGRKLRCEVDENHVAHIEARGDRGALAKIAVGPDQ